MSRNTGATPVQHYGSNVSGTVPALSDMVERELAFNAADGKIWTKIGSNIIELSAKPGFIVHSGTTTVLGISAREHPVTADFQAIANLVTVEVGDAVEITTVSNVSFTTQVMSDGAGAKVVHEFNWPTPMLAIVPTLAQVVYYLPGDVVHVENEFDRKANVGDGTTPSAWIKLDSYSGSGSPVATSTTLLTLSDTAATAAPAGVLRWNSLGTAVDYTTDLNGGSF